MNFSDPYLAANQPVPIEFELLSSFANIIFDFPIDDCLQPFTVEVTSNGFYRQPGLAL